MAVYSGIEVDIQQGRKTPYTDRLTERQANITPDRHIETQTKRRNVCGSELKIGQHSRLDRQPHSDREGEKRIHTDSLRQRQHAG